MPGAGAIVDVDVGAANTDAADVTGSGAATLAGVVVYTDTAPALPYIGGATPGAAPAGAYAWWAVGCPYCCG